MRSFLTRLCLACAGASLAYAEPLLPLGKSLAHGRPLPPPYGLLASYYQQQQDYQIDHLTFDVPGFALPDTLRSKNKSHSWLAQPSVWVLPFLQVYGVLGHVTNETTVSNIPLSGAETLVVSSRGTVRGGGAFLGGAWQAWFAGVSATLTDTKLDVADGSVRTFELAPRLGRTLAWGSVWIGGNFLDSTETSRGVFQLPPGFPLPLSSVTYSAEFVPSARWNAAAGARYQLNRHLAVSAEAGFVKRTSLHAIIELAW